VRYAAQTQTQVAEPDSFWKWANDAYARPGAAEALLSLQDGAGLNVNLLLWTCWIAERFEAAPESAIRNAEAAVSEWRESVTAKLRSARRAMKPFEEKRGYENAKALRGVVKQCELGAERIEVSLLEDVAHRMLTLAHDGDVAARARANLVAYAALAGAAKRKGFSTSLLHQLIDNILMHPADTVSGKGAKAVS
jgi:uncharacterized protein (TIGR02444 family)